MEHLAVAPLYGRLLDLPTNIRLGWKGLPGTYTLAYHKKSQLTTAVKSFITLAPGRSFLSSSFRSFSEVQLTKSNLPWSTFLLLAQMLSMFRPFLFEKVEVSPKFFPSRKWFRATERRGSTKWPKRRRRKRPTEMRRSTFSS